MSNVKVKAGLSMWWRRHACLCWGVEICILAVICLAIVIELQLVTGRHADTGS